MKNSQNRKLWDNNKDNIFYFLKYIYIYIYIISFLLAKKINEIKYLRDVLRK